MAKSRYTVLSLGEATYANFISTFETTAILLPGPAPNVSDFNDLS